MKTLTSKIAALALLGLAACTAGIAAPSYDLHRSNVQACGADAGVSASGVTLVGGKIYRFVTADAAAKYDFSCRSNVTVLPADVDAYDQASIEAYLASAGFTDVTAVLSDKYECDLSSGEQDADAANVRNARSTGFGCYKDDGVAGTYGDSGDVVVPEKERF